MTEKEFSSGWINKLKEQIKIFPQDFIIPARSRNIQLPGKTLVMGEEFFGAYEILTVKGEQVFQAPNHDEAKYIIYASKANNTSIDIPDSPEQVKDANHKFEDYLDTIIKNIETDYRKNFPDMKNGASAVNDIFRALNLTRY